MPSTAVRRVIGSMVIRIIQAKCRGGRYGRPGFCYAKLMFWSRSGTERMRLPVAAK